jgi:hypothetical protein
MYMERKLETNDNIPDMKNRSCTDVFCAIVFVLYIVTMIVIAIIGFQNGDLNRIAQPYDSDGNMCGRGEFEPFPYLFIDNPASVKYGDKTICVATCPANTTDFPLCKPNNDITSCKQIHAYESKAFLHRICLPQVAAIKSAIQGTLNISYVHAFVQDIKEALPIILAMIGITVIVCFVYFYLLENCAPCMVAFVLIGSLGALVGLGVFFWQKYQSLISANTTVQTSTDYKYVAIGLWVAAGILLLLIVLLYSRIKIATKMIAAAADFITDRMMILLIPIVSIILMIGFVSLWGFFFSYLFSNGTIRYDQGDIFGDMVWTTRTEAFVYIMIFGLLWIVSFTISNLQYSVAVLASNWYFNRNDGDSQIAIFTAMIWGVTYQLGSLALGSFTIALLWMIQLILNYFYQKTKEIDPNNFVYKCALCFVTCFERFLKFLNRHAYIEVALRNTNFCGGIAKSVEILTSNFARFAVLSSLVELFLFLGGVILATGMTLIGNLILNAYGSWKMIEYETIAPLVVIFIISLIITGLFNSIFEVSADTMLHCYVYEETQPGHTGESNCPQRMKDLIEESADQYKQLQ